MSTLRLLPHKLCKGTFFCRRIHHLTESNIIDELNEALNTYTDVNLMPFRVDDYHLGQSFSGDSVAVSQYLFDTRDESRSIHRSSNLEPEKCIKTPLIRFEQLYENGFDILRKHLDGKRIPSGDLMVSVGTFQRFIKHKGVHEKCLLSMKKLYKPSVHTITALLANHLFSRLVSNHSMPCVVSSDANRNEFCPCGCHEKIHYGETAFGSEHLFYGQPDIMVFPMGGGASSIIVLEEDDEMVQDYPVDYSKQDEQIIELIPDDTPSLRNPKNVGHIVSQVITFAFYQKIFQIRNPNFVSLDVSLIPTIAVGRDSFDMYMYDIENDILLRNSNDPIPLWEGSSFDGDEGFNMSSVLQFWLLINHLLIKPRLQSSQINTLKGSASFISTLNTEYFSKIHETFDMRVVKETYPEVKEKIINPWYI